MVPSAPHQQRCAPRISLLRTAYRRSALNRGDGSGNADLRSAQRPGAAAAARRAADPNRSGMVPSARERRPRRHSGPEGRGGADPNRSRWCRPHGNADLRSAPLRGAQRKACTTQPSGTLNAEVPADHLGTEVGVRQRVAPAPRRDQGTALSPGGVGARHRCAERSERRLPRSRPDHAERRGPGREANHPRTRGPSRRPPSAGCADQRSAFPCQRVAPPGGMGGNVHHQELNWPEVGVPLPARRSAWWHVRPRRAPPGTELSCPAGCAGGRDHERFSAPDHEESGEESRRNPGYPSGPVNRSPVRSGTPVSRGRFGVLRTPNRPASFPL